MPSMCGIAGVIDFRGRPTDRDALAASQQALAHRGPDDRGIQVFTADGMSAALVHTRLAVLDLSPAGHQPFTDPAGRYALTYNGEIYNFLDLRRELEGDYPFRTRCDTEVLLAAMARWGREGLHRLRGMWAFAFLDLHGRTGWLARDRFGVKPLYYAIEQGRDGRPARLCFASEMRALMPLLPDSGRRLRIDRVALHAYLSLGFIPHPWSIYQQVRKLPPGHILPFDANGPQPVERYYRIRPGRPPADYRDAQCRLRELIAEAVAVRRIADVPLGAFLSGGLDSSVIVAELARAGGTVKTFSIGYAEHDAYDETHYARLVAERFATQHHVFRLTCREVIEAIPPLLDHIAEPFADASLIPTSLVSRCTRRHVTVALSGDGGDELFAGYWRYLGHAYLRRYRRLPSWLRRRLLEPILAAAPSARSTRWLNRLRQARKLLRASGGDAFERHSAWARIGEADLADRLLNRAAAEPSVPTDVASADGDPLQQASRECSPSRGFDPAVCLRAACNEIAPELTAPDELSPLLLADLAVSLPADMLHKVDLASMRYALEVRVPLLDPAVVEFAASLPIEWRLGPARAGSQKRILRDAYRDLLPPEVLARRKMGFEVPVGEFLRNELRELYHETVRPDVLESLGIRPDVAASLYEEHASRREDRADILYALLVLCHWHVTCGAPVPSRQAFDA